MFNTRVSIILAIVVLLEVLGLPADHQLSFDSCQTISSANLSWLSGASGAPYPYGSHSRTITIALGRAT
ncbi:MAG: hypothetical protein GX054_05595 [Clostridiales bacterium]|nr:hypothetical protein [Clostridiales bacterium]